MSIVYPHITTSADLLKSIVRVDDLFPFLTAQEASAAALVNTRLYGVLPFWEAARRAGIHPVLGLPAALEYEDRTYPAVLYAKSDAGYRNLLKLSSALATRDREDVPDKWAAAYREGLICVLLNDGSWLPGGQDEFIRYLRTVYGQDVYGAVMRPGGVRTEVEAGFVTLCDDHGVPVIATQASRYLTKEETFAFEAASAIAQGVKLSDDERPVPPADQHVPEAEEFRSWFTDHPEWLEASARLMSECQVTVPTDQKLLPVFPLPESISAAQYLRSACEKGMAARGCTHPDYQKRLDYELTVIESMGYSDYFLIVADFVKFARDSHILTGPGRGSSAGSLVAYVLAITDVDPLVHGLLFERFLNPERVTLPDIDIDFADYRRQEVIEYVARKYGPQRTAQIITFGTLSAKAVARDVGRVFGFPPEDLETISKMIPSKPGITLADAESGSAEFRAWITENEERKKWFQTASALEGLPRNASTHAAGIILSPIPLVNVVPIEKGNEGIFMTQWPMNELEKTGLLKMDFLGLRNLTILERIRHLLNRDTGHWLDYRQLPLNDEQTYQLLAAGDTTGIFQLESEGMRRALQLIQPTGFNDIVAVNALFRPGPMDFIPLYAKRKKGEEPVRFLHPALEPILGETYGVIVYQEQIMRIASEMAGFSLGEADLLRRAVSKKKREILDDERAHFIKGATGKGYSQPVANDVYDLIVRFANYGFPKSHAVAYSLISYWLAYAKAHHPAYFYAALLSGAAGNPEKVNQLLQEAKSRHIPLLPPSVQKSGSGFRVEGGGVRFGLNAVKDVPGSAVKAILEARKTGPFDSLFHIAERISGVHFKRKSMEPLIKAGAFDDFGVDRSVLLASLEAAAKHAELVRPSEEPGLFDPAEDIFIKPKYTKASLMPDRVKLEFEKEVLGFYLSEHPLEQEKQKRGRNFLPVNKIRNCRNGQAVTVLAMVLDVKQIRTKKGEAMAFLTLQDETGETRATVFPREYAAYAPSLGDQAVIEIQGTVEFWNQKPSIICKSITF
ncbi:DNA polymerase III subunit alpha [Planococcus lenghuensis]|uniref:DNA-directed DNA polymerase n=1 Tax=Planococcus lenghuensis TaxID=2213202 RepID=A0A1Q2KX95_9BACL|nr:DNA polymerase III subunit alpha [Planococcus lenghuensis]AQQ52810.1 DNA polymerase III subunit alpha [Planococcus lenghuensis]